MRWLSGTGLVPEGRHLAREAKRAQGTRRGCQKIAAAAPGVLGRVGQFAVWAEPAEALRSDCQGQRAPLARLATGALSSEPQAFRDRYRDKISGQGHDGSLAATPEHGQLAGASERCHGPAHSACHEHGAALGLRFSGAQRCRLSRHRSPRRCPRSWPDGASDSGAAHIRQAAATRRHRTDGPRSRYRLRDRLFRRDPR